MTRFTTDLAIQTWIMYAIAVILIGGRLESRRIQEGSMKKLWIEEYIMLFVLCTLTADFWAINQVAVNGSNYMSPQEAASLSPAGVKQAVYGSKMTLVVEMLTLATLWLTKGCLCLMFYRMTHKIHGLNLIVKMIGGYCVTAYVLVNVFYLAVWCRPFNGYWAVPVKHAQCATYYHHLIFATAWNISADLMLIAVPLKLLPGLQLPLKKKILIIGVLSLGVFNILAAILNRYYNFAHPNSTEYLKWYIGEVGTAVYVVNIPACWPLLRKIFPFATRTNTPSGNISAAGHSSYRLRSDLRSRSRHIQSLPESSESEENLAIDGSFPGKSGSGHSGSRGSWGQNGYSVSANAKPMGEEEVVELPQMGGIMKTVEVSQQEVTWAEK